MSQYIRCNECKIQINNDFQYCLPCWFKTIGHTFKEKYASGYPCSLCGGTDSTDPNFKKIIDSTFTTKYCLDCDATLRPVTDKQIHEAIQQLREWV